MKKSTFVAATLISSIAVADVGDIVSTTIDLTGAESWGLWENDNQLFATADLPALDAGQSYSLQSLSWDNVEFETFNGSWASEIRFLLYLDEGIGAVGGLSSETSTGTFGPLSGSFDATAESSPFWTSATSSFGIGFYDTYDDFGSDSGANAIFSAGTATASFVVVPAPGALALLGLAGMTRRRRS